MKIHSQIGYQIEKSGLKDKFIAEKVGGVTQKTVYNWKKGLSFPSFEKAFILAKVLNCTVDDLAEIREEE